MLLIVVAVLLSALTYFCYPRPFHYLYSTDHFSSTDFKKVNVKAKLPKKTGKVYGIIGGGFVGRNIVDHLLMRGEEKIRVLDFAPISYYKEKSAVTFVRGDITKYEDVEKFLKGVDVVISTAAIIKFYHRLPHQYNISYAVNVTGAQNIIKGCLHNNVPICIMTSSAHVGLGWDNKGRTNMTEDDDSEKHFNHYCSTKKIGETLLLKANGSLCQDGKTLLRTGAIRPASAVFGDQDMLVSQPMYEKPVIAMPLDQLMDYVYVENVSYGHLLLEEKLQNNPQSVAGHTFIISNEAPITREQFYSTFKCFLPSLQIQILPTWLLYSLAYFSEFVQLLFKGRYSLGEMDQITPPVMATCVYTHTFSDEKAKKLLGYSPLYNVEEGIQKSVALHDARQIAKYTK